MIGSILEWGCDKVGAPEWVGDVVGIAADAYSGDWASVALAAPDLLENVCPSVAEKLSTLERAGGFSAISAGVKFVSGDYAGAAMDAGKMSGQIVERAAENGDLPIDVETAEVISNEGTAALNQAIAERTEPDALAAAETTGEPEAEVLLEPEAGATTEADARSADISVRRLQEGVRP